MSLGRIIEPRTSIEKRPLPPEPPPVTPTNQDDLYKSSHANNTTKLTTLPLHLKCGIAQTQAEGHQNKMTRSWLPFFAVRACLSEFIRHIEKDCVNPLIEKVSQPETF